MAKAYDVEIEIVEQRGHCPNGHKIGEKFLAGRKTPAGICMGAFASLLPFLVADPGALWNDTVGSVTSTYRIVGYGLSALLLNVGLIDGRFDYYPFLPLVLAFWLPLTAWLLWSQRKAALLWPGAAGFAVSMFVLLFLSRVFQSSYLVWPLTGIAVAFLLAAVARASPSPAPP